MYDTEMLPSAILDHLETAILVRIVHLVPPTTISLHTTTLPSQHICKYRVEFTLLHYPSRFDNGIHLMASVFIQQHQSLSSTSLHQAPSLSTTSLHPQPVFIQHSSSSSTRLHQAASIFLQRQSVFIPRHPSNSNPTRSKLLFNAHNEGSVLGRSRRQDYFTLPSNYCTHSTPSVRRGQSLLPLRPQPTQSPYIQADPTANHCGHKRWIRMPSTAIL